MSYVRDCVALSGLGLSLYGAAMYSPALALVLSGAVLIAGAFGWSFIRSKQ